MPTETVYLIGGGLLLSLLKGRNTAEAKAAIPGAPGTVQTVPVDDGPDGAPISIAASGTGPDAPLATTTGVVNGIPIAHGLDPAIKAIPPLSMVLDNDTALKFRAYAALNPSDFEIFLNRYADYIVMQEDMYFRGLTDPPSDGYHPTPQMIASMGPAAYRVIQGLNGVAAGNYGDLFGLASTVAGQIPGLNDDFVSALQGLALGYRAFTAALTIADLSAVAAANGVSIMNITSTMLQGAGMSTTLAMAPIQSLSGVLMAVGLCVDIGFTIVSDKPNLQKAIDVALDAISLVCLFIPVFGWIIAIVVQLVKFLIDLFAEQLFYSSKERHDRREQIEAAKYGEMISPIFGQIADSYTPRELFRTLVGWSAIACGGAHPITMNFSVRLLAGDQLMVNGRLYTVPADTSLLLGHQPGCYWFAGTEWDGITNDEQAWALGRYATDNGVIPVAQVGISQALKDLFEMPARNLVVARAEPMREFTRHGVPLDQIDQIAAEYRAQPYLHLLASFFGHDRWQTLIGLVLEREWFTWASSVTHGTLTDFARSLGHQTMYALRAFAFKPWIEMYDEFQTWNTLWDWKIRRFSTLDTGTGSFYVEPNLEPTESDFAAMISPDDPISLAMLRYVVAAERHLDALDAARARQAEAQAAIAAKAFSGATLDANDIATLYPGEDEYSRQMAQYYAGQISGGSNGG